MLLQDYLDNNYAGYSIVEPISSSRFKEKNEKKIKKEFNKCKKELYPMLFKEVIKGRTSFNRLINRYSCKKGITMLTRENQQSDEYIVYKGVSKYDINSSYANSLITDLFPAGEIKTVLAASQGIKTIDDLFNWLDGRLAEFIEIKIYDAIVPKWKKYYYTTYDGVHSTTSYNPETNEFYKETLTDLKYEDGYASFCGNSQSLKNFIRMYDFKDYDIMFFSYYTKTQRISYDAIKWLIRKKKEINKLSGEDKVVAKIVYNKLVYGNLLNREYKKTINFRTELFSEFLLLGVWIPEYAKSHLLDELETEAENGNLIYADTDCIATTGSIRKESINKEVIGFFKEELFKGDMIIYSIKKYILVDNINRILYKVGITPEGVKVCLKE